VDNPSSSLPGSRKPVLPSSKPPTNAAQGAANSAAKFPAKPGGGIKPLVLPRRVSPLQRAQEASQATAEARRSIDAIMSQSRTPWTSGKPALSGTQVEGLEKALRALETKVAEREMALAEAENKLSERDRALAEMEALLLAREKVIDAMRKQPPATGGSSGVNPAELEALGKLKEELDRQEASMKEQRQANKEREEFLEQSEAALFEKMQAQQERETELEQKAEDVKRAMLKAGLIKEEPKGPMEKA
jgi:septal ring factor EnvC (AmiA/AmiB activator)